jgi:hypothetical protein
MCKGIGTSNRRCSFVPLLLSWRAVAEDIVVVDDDVADVDADPEFNPFALRHGRILIGYAALDFNGTAYGGNFSKNANTYRRFN